MLGCLRGYFIWLVVSLFLFFDILLRVFPNILVPALQQHFQVNAYQLGLLSSSFMYAYGLMQIPAGILIDRFGLRLALFVGCISAALSVGLMGLANEFWLGCLARVLMGAGAAFAFLGCMQVIVEWFPLQRRAMLTGFTMMIGALAGIVCNAFLIHLAQRFGWQSVLGVIIIFGMMLAIAIILFVTHPPTRQGQLSKLCWSDLKALFMHVENWQLGLVCACIYLPYAILNDLWGVPFFRVADHLTKVQAGYVISTIWLGWLFGSPIVGIWADKINNRVWVMLQLTLLQLIILALLLYVSWSSFWVVEGLGFAIGVTAAAMALCYVYGQMINPQQTTAASSALINSMVTAMVLITLPLVGTLMDYGAGGNQSIDSVLHYSIAGYRIALSILMVAPAVAVILLYRIRSTRYTVGP